MDDCWRGGRRWRYFVMWLCSLSNVCAVLDSFFLLFFFSWLQIEAYVLVSGGRDHPDLEGEPRDIGGFVSQPQAGDYRAGKGSI
jgi:hypothetical protein